MLKYMKYYIQDRKESEENIKETSRIKVEVLDENHEVVL